VRRRSIRTWSAISFGVPKIHLVFRDLVSRERVVFDVTRPTRGKRLPVIERGEA
jgi:hypothetical protein